MRFVTPFAPVTRCKFSLCKKKHHKQIIICPTALFRGHFMASRGRTSATSTDFNYNSMDIIFQFRRLCKSRKVNNSSNNSLVIIGKKKVFPFFLSLLCNSLNIRFALSLSFTLRSFSSSSDGRQI